MEKFESNTFSSRGVMRILLNIYCGVFYENSLLLLAVNQFCKKLHRKFLTRSYIHLCQVEIFCKTRGKTVFFFLLNRVFIAILFFSSGHKRKLYEQKMLTYVCVSGDKKCQFCEKFCVRIKSKTPNIFSLFRMNLKKETLMNKSSKLILYWKLLVMPKLQGTIILLVL